VTDHCKVDSWTNPYKEFLQFFRLNDTSELVYYLMPDYFYEPASCILIEKHKKTYTVSGLPDNVTYDATLGLISVNETTTPKTFYVYITASVVNYDGTLLTQEIRY
jgi:hypothetical protein